MIGSFAAGGCWLTRARNCVEVHTNQRVYPLRRDRS